MYLLYLLFYCEYEQLSEINYTLTPVFNNGLKPPCLAERPLSHLLSRVAEPTGLSR